MKITRRDFLKLTSLSAVGAVACNVFDDREMTIQSPSEMPEDLVTGSDNWYATLCQQCPEREGILVRVMEGRAKKVRGNPKYPTNVGKQSARCEAGLQALYHPDRLAKPRTRIAGAPRGEPNGEIGWDEAVDILRGRLDGLGDRSEMLMITGPLRGHMGAVASRFVETYGGRHLAFEPLEQTVLREAVKRVFAQDILPDYDIGNVSYLLSFGADFLSTWVAPVRFSRGFGEFRSKGDGGHRGTFVHADPRYSMTAASADEWLPVKPGMEGVLALSMAQVIVSEDLGRCQCGQRYERWRRKGSPADGLGGLSTREGCRKHRDSRDHPRRTRCRRDKEDSESLRHQPAQPGHRRGARPRPIPTACSTCPPSSPSTTW